MNDLRNHINYLKQNCDEFVRTVHNYMLKENWTWYDSKYPPTEERIKSQLFDLLDDLYHASGTSTGGFNVRKNEDLGRIEVYFGRESMSGKGFKLFSQVSISSVLGFVLYFCDNTPSINKDYVMGVYEKFIKDVNSTD